MSFSMDVKKEITCVAEEARHCGIAELAALLNTCARMVCVPNGYSIWFRADAVITDRIIALLDVLFHAKCEREGKVTNENALRRSVTYTVSDTTATKEILWATGLLDKQSQVLSRRIDPLVVNRTCCKRAYIRGAFLGGGSVSGPEKGYHLEFVTTDALYAKQLAKQLQSFELEPKLVVRKGYDIVYFKKGEEISDVLKIINANAAMMQFENKRVAKDMDNTINRVSNCLAVNTDKTVVAAVKQMEDIQLIRNTIGLQALPPTLMEIAEIRLNHPIVSLKEIGEMLNPPIGKSGVNHRLRRISSMADSLR